MAVDNGKDRNGDQRDPDWIQVVVFGPYAQAIAKHLGKGHLVGVTGAIKSRKYVDETTGDTRSYLNVVASSVEFLARPRGTGEGSADDQSEPAYATPDAVQTALVNGAAGVVPSSTDTSSR